MKRVVLIMVVSFLSGPLFALDYVARCKEVGGMAGSLDVILNNGVTEVTGNYRFSMPIAKQLGIDDVSGRVETRLDRKSCKGSSEKGLKRLICSARHAPLIVRRGKLEPIIVVAEKVVVRIVEVPSSNRSKKLWQTRIMLKLTPQFGAKFAKAGMVFGDHGSCAFNDMKIRR